MVISKYLDDHHLRRADRDRYGDHRQYGQKEEGRQIGGMQLRQLQKLCHVRYLSQAVNAHSAGKARSIRLSHQCRSLSFRDKPSIQTKHFPIPETNRSP